MHRGTSKLLEFHHELEEKALSGASQEQSFNDQLS